MKFYYNNKYYYYFIFFIICISFFIFFKFSKLFYKNHNNYKLKIYYEDRYIIVVNKPPHIATHGNPDWKGENVVDILTRNGFRLDQNDIEEEQDGIVSRLDVGTSGLTVLAKNNYSFYYLKDQYRYKTVKKIYHALVEGKVEPNIGTIYAPIKKSDKRDNYVIIDKNGKPCVTHYVVLKVFPATKDYPTLSLIEVNLETGRQHQIRKHFSYIGNPLVGDLKYGADQKVAEKFNIDRQWLHAKYLEFNHPLDGKRYVFNTNYPDDLIYSLQILNKQISN